MFLFLFLFLQVEDNLDTVISDDDDGTADTTEEFGDDTLVETLGAFLLEDGGEAVDGALVEALGDGLLGLEHHTTADGVEGVVEGHDDGTGGGDGDEGGGGTEDTLVLLVGVEVLDLGEAAELTGTVDEGASDGDGPAGVEAGDTLGLDGGHDAVHDAVELGLAGADVGGEAGAGEVEGVADGVGDGTGEATGEELGGEGLPELGLGVVLGEDLVVDEIVEGEGGTLLGSVAEAVDEVTTPEGADTLLGGDTLQAVHDTVVALDLSADDIGVGVHGLEEELDTLDGGHGGLGDGTGDATDDEILEELLVPGLLGLGLLGSLLFGGSSDGSGGSGLISGHFLKKVKSCFFLKDLKKSFKNTSIFYLSGKK
jgi:hypothetical protein